MSESKRKFPSILLILSDDQGAWATGCSGNSEIETPALDRLAASGIRFENFFCASPVCSPARATLLTGRIPSQHGVHDWIKAGDTTKEYEPAGNGELIEYLAGQPGYTDLLADAGYSCGISGKWHLGDSHHPQKGFDYWAVHAKGGGPYFHAPMIRDGKVYQEPAYVTEVITDNALRWLEERKGKDRPFYLSVHYTAPHSPWSRENHPPDVFDRYYNDCPFESVPDGLTPPDWVRYTSIPVKTPQERRERLSGYYAAVTAMDRDIGRLLDYVGVENPCDAYLPGKSFAPAFDGTAVKGDRPIVIYNEYGPVRMIRDSRWKYVHRYRHGPNELYDLENDPCEERNLSGDAAFQSIEKELRGTLTEWFSRYVDPQRDGTLEQVTGSGQLDKCGSDAGGKPAFSTSRVKSILKDMR